VKTGDAGRIEPDMSTTSGPVIKPDWLPDWKDITNYPDPKHTSRRQWAWEFLRRNPRYQQFWNEREAYLHRGDDLKVVQPGTETYEELKDSEPLSLGKMPGRPKQFGLELLAPPSMSSTDPKFGNKRPMFVTECVDHWMKPVDWEGPFEIHEVLEDPAEVMILVNLRWSIRRQVDSVEKFLKAKKKQLNSLGVLNGSDRRMKTENYRNCLRLLDGESDNASQKKMAEVIFGIIEEYPDHKFQQRVNANLKTAKFLRDKGYIFLAMEPARR
jgi:hypothetical protein